MIVVLQSTLFSQRKLQKPVPVGHKNSWPRKHFGRVLQEEEYPWKKKIKCKGRIDTC